MSRFVDGAYTEPEVLGPSINGELYDFEPFIAPDESYLILSRIDNEETYPYADLYISFKNAAGNWTDAVPMDELNETYHEIGANVTRDGKYLFFLRSTYQGLSAHWVSADIINKYRSNMFSRINDIEIVADMLGNSSANWVDYNNDGHEDLFISYLDEVNQLFANNGNGSFTKITGDVIVSEGGSTSSSWGDYDNNGYIEPYITNGHAHVAATNYFYLNQGDGSFSKVTDDITVTTSGYPMTSTCADYDNDGNLDLYVVDIGATPDASPWTDRLYKGDGTGHFTRIESGDIANSYGAMSSGASWSDYDNDGDLDLMVLKVDSENLLFRNDGTTFTLI
ncbi:MAG: VCBS repeat-containing protein, partial [candidate division Zixibacteria bacterium]|nr:VCBS repeat-containing protein [candidate division Zixibacteria bacterium]